MSEALVNLDENFHMPSSKIQLQNHEQVSRQSHDKSTEITHVLHIKFVPLITVNNLKKFRICSTISIRLLSVDFVCLFVLVAKSSRPTEVKEEMCIRLNE